MKWPINKLLVSVMVVIAFTYNGLSQSDSIMEVINDIKSQYASLDHSTMSSDILFNQGFIILNRLEDIHNNIPVSTRLNPWLTIYNSINNSKLSGTCGLPPDSFLISNYNDIKEYDPSTIGISILYFKGDYLSDTTIKTMIANNNFSNPPYEPMTIFAGTLLYQYTLNNEVIFNFKPECFFTNLSNANSLYIDFDDDYGYRNINLLSETTTRIIYSSCGEKNIIFKLITNNSDTILSYSRLNVLSLHNERPTVEGIIPDTGSIDLFSNLKSDPDINVSYMKYKYFEGCDNILDKPVIICEGFDIFGNMSINYLAGKWENTISNLRERGYDVFVINLRAPDHTLQHNADRMEEFIREINNHKTGNNEGVYIGESMGGIIGRISLKEMENKDYDHQFGLFVALDSPMKGANIPVGLQWLVFDFAWSIPGIAVVGGYFADLLEEIFGWDIPYIDAYQMLNSNAARQMLARHYIVFSNSYDNTQSYLDNLGYPINTRNIAYVDGSNNASLQQGVTPGGEMINRHFITGFYNIWYKAWYDSPNTYQKVSRTTIIKLFIGIPRFSYINHYYFFDSKPWVDAPGSNVVSQSLVPYFTFVPSVSAIDIDRNVFNTGDFNYFNDFNTNNTAFLTQNHLTPFNDIYAKNSNSIHTDIFSQITSAIETSEVMYDNMYLQNRGILYNRDYEASDQIIAGSDLAVPPSLINGANITGLHQKNVIIGDFIVKSGTTVNFKAGNSITLEPGFMTEDGANFNTEFIDICSSNKNKEIELPIPVIKGCTSICGEASYSVDNQDNYIVGWKLKGENTLITSYGDEFNTPGNLLPGQYSLICTLITPLGESTNSKIITVKCSPEITSSKENNKKQDKNVLIIYPNPGKDIFYISLNSNSVDGMDATVNIRDVYNRNIFSNTVVYDSRLVINLSELPDGVYLINIVLNNQEYFGKIVKN